MKHSSIILYSLFLILFFSCNSSKGTRLERKMNTYLGKSKQEIMLEYGINPVKDGWVDGLGRVLAYTDIKTSGLGIYSQQYYRHTVFVLDQDFKCIAWSVRNEEMPFDRLDVRIFRSSF